MVYTIEFFIPQHKRGDNMANAYDLAQRINKTGNSTRPVELGKVTCVNPLTIKIDNTEYSAANWLFYEPTFMGENIKLWNLELKNDVTGATYKYNTRCESSTSDIRYHEGDLVAVQQMDGDRSFLILAKVKRVV